MKKNQASSMRNSFSNVNFFKFSKFKILTMNLRIFGLTFETTVDEVENLYLNVKKREKERTKKVVFQETCEGALL